MKKLLFLMLMAKSDDVVAAFVQWRRTLIGNQARGREAMPKYGYEETDEPGALTPDGREVVEMWGRRWVLRPEVHAEQMALALEQARERDAAIAAQETAETKSVAGTDSLSAMVCPKCGDSLQHSAVCPACAAGRLGYRHRYTCVCGGVDLVSREAL